MAYLKGLAVIFFSLHLFRRRRLFSLRRQLELVRRHVVAQLRLKGKVLVAGLTLERVLLRVLLRRVDEQLGRVGKRDLAQRAGEGALVHESSMALQAGQHGKRGPAYSTLVRFDAGVDLLVVAAGGGLAEGHATALHPTLVRLFACVCDLMPSQKQEVYISWGERGGGGW